VLFASGIALERTFNRLEWSKSRTTLDIASSNHVTFPASSFAVIFIRKPETGRSGGTCFFEDR